MPHRDIARKPRKNHVDQAQSSELNAPSPRIVSLLLLFHPSRCHSPPIGPTTVTAPQTLIQSLLTIPPSTEKVDRRFPPIVPLALPSTFFGPCLQLLRFRWSPVLRPKNHGVLAPPAPRRRPPLPPCRAVPRPRPDLPVPFSPASIAYPLHNRRGSAKKSRECHAN
jgi:hypothetical protein